MAAIRLQVTDTSTGKDSIITLSIHDAKKLYLALRELVGDVQYQARPGELITLSPVSIKVG